MNGMLIRCESSLVANGVVYLLLFKINEFSFNHIYYKI
jgi:hypothetical protein